MALFGSSSPFGASTSSPFGGASPSPNPFGTTTPSSPFGANQNTSIFGAKPFGSPTFGSQTGSSLFGGTATGVFGAPQSSPLGSSTPAFGASSAPAFGSTPSFGSGTSIFGQKPATPFGGFGSTSTQANPFGSTPFGQTQPAFGSPSFGSTVSAFGSSPPAFGSTPFGSTTPATPAFGVSSAPAFGASSTPAFGATSAPVFGASSAPSAPTFGTSSTSLFGSTSFGSSSTPAFGSTSVFGSGSGASPFGASSTPAFGTGSSPAFGSSTFTSSPFGTQQRAGSRATAYTVTNDVEAGVSGQAGKLMCISAMPAFKNKSPEELRWEDYQAGDKGGPSSIVQQPGAGIFGQAASSTPFGGNSTFSPTPTPNPFGANTPSIFGSKPAGSFGMPGTGSSSPSPFGSLSTGSAFGQASSSAFGLGISSPFGTGSTPGFSSGFGTSSSTFGSPAPAFSSAPGFSSPAPNMFSAGTSAFGSNPFGQSQTSGALFSTSNQPFGVSASAFSTPPIGSNIFGSTASPFQTSKPPGLSQPGASIFGGIQSNPVQQQTMGSFGFSSLGQSQPAVNAFGAPSISGAGLSMFTQQPSVPMPVSNPFGTLPAIPQMSIGRSAGTGPSVQYGISSLPVSERSTQVRSTSLLTPRHITQRSRVRMQARRYHPNKDVPKVSFFSDGEETHNASKADALFVPRENPRALFIRQQPDHSPSSPASAGLKIRDIATPVKQGDGTPDASSSQPQETESPVQAGLSDGIVMPTSSTQEPINSSKNTPKQNGLQVEHTHRGNGYISITGHRAGEAAVAYEHGADIEALMPKLRHSDYYIQPRVQELAAKERAEPGYCRRVKGFVVGRHGYGFVKFLGETDVRGLDLESIIQFNKCEVLVYMDESKKPPPGVGLNKPAEITLLNVKSVDKKSGQHLSEGVEVEKFEKRLKKKTEEQGAEFLSYDAIKGEWNFRVKHFSKYCLEDAGCELLSYHKDEVSLDNPAEDAGKITED